MSIKAQNYLLLIFTFTVSLLAILFKGFLLFYVFFGGRGGEGAERGSEASK